MLFENTLKRIIRRILKADFSLGPVYLSRVDLTNVYMRLWLHMEDVPSLALLIPNNHIADTQLIGFHLALTIGYIGISTLFCATTEVATDMANNSILRRQAAPPYPLETEASSHAADYTGAPTPSKDTRWYTLPSYQQAKSLASVDVYLNNFIAVL